MSLILNGTTGISDVDGTAAAPAIRGTDTNTGIFFPAADTIAFAEGGVEAVRIDSSGNVGIGTSSPSSKLHVQVTNATAYSSGITGNGLRLFNSSETTGQYVGITFNGEPTSGNNGLATIMGTTTGSGNMDLTFSTKGSSTLAERARIDSSGNLLVGTTTLSGDERLNVTKNTAGQEVFRCIATNNSTPWGMTASYSAADPNNTSSWFYSGVANGTVRFNVRSNGGIGNYSANNVNLSDQREKKNIELAPNYLNKICQIPVKTFLFNDQTDTDLNLGAIAQDVQAVCPELVMESNWASKEEEPKMRLSIYQTDLQYALMKSIQEQQALITALTTRITALEGAAA